MESEGIIAEITGLREHTDKYMQRGVQLIELMQHAEIIYKRATPETKRKLVELVSSNLLLSDGVIEYKIRKPFNYLILKNENLVKTVGNKKAISKDGFNINLVLPRGGGHISN